MPDPFRPQKIAAATPAGFVELSAELLEGRLSFYVGAGISLSEHTAIPGGGEEAQYAGTRSGVVGIAAKSGRRLMTINDRAGGAGADSLADQVCRS